MERLNVEKHQVLKGSSMNWEKQQEQGPGAEARHIQSGKKNVQLFPREDDTGKSAHRTNKLSHS